MQDLTASLRQPRQAGVIILFADVRNQSSGQLRNRQKYVKVSNHMFTPYTYTMLPIYVNLFLKNNYFSGQILTSKSWPGKQKGEA